MKGEMTDWHMCGVWGGWMGGMDGGVDGGMDGGGYMSCNAQPA